MGRYIVQTAYEKMAQPITTAIRTRLHGVRDEATIDDLLFLERWEMLPSPNMGTVLRAAQIRRANPKLAAALRAELASR